MTVKIPDSLPWVTDVDLPYARQPRIEATGGRNIAVVGNSQNEIQDIWESDAAYIVHACNAYPALVAALKFYTGNHEPGLSNPNAGPWGRDSDDFGRVARAALEAAGAEP